MKQKGHVFKLLTLFVLLLLGATNQLRADDKLPFAIFQEKALGILPFGNRLFEGSTKEGFHFLFVAVESMKNGQAISADVMNYSVVDSSGSEYVPIAFCLPSDLGNPFLVIGYSFEGNIRIAYDGFVKTYFCLLYLVPKNISIVALKDPEGKKAKLSILKKWDCPQAMKVEGYRSDGRVDFGTPTVKDNGWGLQ